MGIFDRFKKREQTPNKYKSQESKDDFTQEQTAGKNSTQFQIGTYVFNQGISEERARVIFGEMIPKALEEYTNDAYETAISRINKLEEKVIPKIMNIDEAINAFSDPAFQLLIKKAQRSAAATERTEDYELLSELLICHIQKGNQRKNRVGISKAVEIVDYIDNDALCALTIAYAIKTYTPKSGNIREGLSLLNELFSKLLYMELPNGTEWIEHLDMLGAVKYSKIGHFKTFKEYYSEQLNGYICIGLSNQSEEYNQACGMLNNVNITPDCLASNGFLDGYVRLPVANKDSIKTLKLSNGIEIDQSQISVLESVFDMYLDDTKLKEIAAAEFINIWDSFDTLRKIRFWWESIPISFDITKIGEVLAHTNAKRCESSLPDLL